MEDFLSAAGKIALAVIAAVFAVLAILIGIAGIVEVWRSIFNG